MPVPNVAAFLSYVLVTTFTPGPNNIMSMANASRYGFRRSIRFNIGIFFGFFVVIMLCCLFSMTLYSLIPAFKPVMTWVGATYIVRLAWKTCKSTPCGAAEGTTRPDTLLSGLALQFVNPKVILYGITTVSTFIVPHYRSLAALTGFSLLLASVGFVATCCWSLFGSMFQIFLVNNGKVVNSAMGLMLLYCAFSLFL